MDKNENPFRYISLHSFIRDACDHRNKLKFSPENFMKALKRYVESEDEALDVFNKGGVLSAFGLSSDKKVGRALSGLQESSRNSDLAETKQHMTDFLNEISKNSISGKTIMDAFVIMNASLGVEVDCSAIRTKDFKEFSPEESKRVNKGIVNLAMKNFRNSNMSEVLDMDEAIVLVDQSLKNKNTEKTRSNELIASMYRKGIK